MNIKRMVAYAVYYGVWGLVFYGMFNLATLFHKGYGYNVNLVCLAIGLMFGCAVEPFMRFIKNKIDEKIN